MVLAGDVGGTNARLATVELNGGAARIVRKSRYASGDYPGLAPKAVPAQLARRGVWFLDRAAAARLTPRRVGA